MKKITIIFFVLLAIVLIAILKNSFSINIGSNAITPTQNNDSSFETKESNDGPVSVAVTPRSLEEANILGRFISWGSSSRRSSKI